MEAIFGFVENDASRTVEHALGNFFADVRGKAVHKIRVLFRERHEVFVDLIRTEFAQTAFFFFFHSHAHPDIGVEHVRVFRGDFGIGREREIRFQSVGFELRVKLCVRLVAGGTAEHDFHAVSPMKTIFRPRRHSPIFFGSPRLQRSASVNMSV